MTKTFADGLLESQPLPLALPTLLNYAQTECYRAWKQAEEALLMAERVLTRQIPEVRAAYPAKSEAEVLDLAMRMGAKVHLETALASLMRVQLLHALLPELQPGGKQP